MDRNRPPRVALYGTFDVLNFGDLLFPHVLRSGLGLQHHELVAFSPRGGAIEWADCIEARPLATAAEYDADLHIIGGGNIVHGGDTKLPEYREIPGGSRSAYASLWLGAGLIAARSGTRLAWNAPGVPSAIAGGGLRGLRDMIVAASEYVSLRDAGSLAFLGGAPSAVIVPDTALDIALAWPAATLESKAHEAFARRGVAVPAQWLVVHVNGRYLDADITRQAAIIDEICGTMQAVPVLVALGPCHGDDALARSVGEQLRGPAVIVDRPEGLREIAALIAHGIGYVGSSLHGLIAALSYGRPGVAVANRRMIKFAGFLEQVAMSYRLAVTWRDAARSMPRNLLPLDAAERAAIGQAQMQIGQHWNRLHGLITGGETDATVRARTRLAQWVATGADEVGNWRAFERVLEGGDAQGGGPSLEDPPSDTAKPGGTCNICGGVEFRAGRKAMPGLVGYGALCSGCGASARHRAMRTVFDALRVPGPPAGTCLRFARDRIIAGAWFKVVEDVVAGPRGTDLAALDLATGSVDVAVCVDVLERAADPGLALQNLMRIVRPGGHVFLTLRHVPGRAITMDWGFPRGDRDGEFRMFGADVEAMLLSALPEAVIVVAQPIDPVTGIGTTAYLLAHAQWDLQALVGSAVSWHWLTRRRDPAHLRLV